MCCQMAVMFERVALLTWGPCADILVGATGGWSTAGCNCYRYDQPTRKVRLHVCGLTGLWLQMFIDFRQICGTTGFSQKAISLMRILTTLGVTCKFQRWAVCHVKGSQTPSRGIRIHVRTKPGYMYNLPSFLAFNITPFYHMCLRCPLTAPEHSLRPLCLSQPGCLTVHRCWRRTER